MASTIPNLEWEDFLEQFAWAQGEHVSLIGPTGGGKTTLALEILSRRKYVCVIGVKPKDPTLEKLKKDGFRETPKWDPTDKDQKILLWPRLRKAGMEPWQQKVLDEALREIYSEGCWCILADESSYLCEDLKLTPHMKRIWQMGRSQKISLIAVVQRPRYIPLAAYSQATHIFFWRNNDEQDLKRIGEIGSVDSKLVKETVRSLPKHDVLYVNTRTGQLVQTRVNIKKGG